MIAKAAIAGLALRRGRTAAPAVIAACLALGFASSARAQDARLADGSHCAIRSIAALPQADPLGLELLGLGSGGPESREPVDRPCSGPLCSKGPAAPSPAPAAPPPAPPSDPWALVAADPAIDRAPFSSAPASDLDARPILLGSGVFHPPR